jgi:glycerol-3-phosphate dehydrogenase (NAD(P)+)
MHIAVLGAGAWGCALAVAVAERHHSVLAARDAARAASLRAQGVNQRYLPDVPLPSALAIADSFAQALQDAFADPREIPLVIVATPVAGLRAALREVAAAARAHGPRPASVVWLCKGFEADTGALPHAVAQEELAGCTGLAHGVLTGPSFAQEVARGLPVALTIASGTTSLKRQVTAALHGGAIRVYASDDVVGAEVGGAVKNVLAIATGICDGLALGSNARAALVTRGLAEMTRFGVALGARAETFTGLTGMGDLILTATGDLSRNRQIGLWLAQGGSLEDGEARLGHVAEGVRCARVVARLAQAHGVSMPIVEAVCQVLFDHVPAAKAVQALLARDPKEETR